MSDTKKLKKFCWKCGLRETRSENNCYKCRRKFSDEIPTGVKILPKTYGRPPEARPQPSGMMLAVKGHQETIENEHIIRAHRAAIYAEQWETMGVIDYADPRLFEVEIVEPVDEDAMEALCA